LGPLRDGNIEEVLIEPMAFTVHSALRHEIASWVCLYGRDGVSVVGMAPFFSSVLRRFPFGMLIFDECWTFRAVNNLLVSHPPAGDGNDAHSGGKTYIDAVKSLSSPGLP
jgi:hypothetical protein